MSIKNYNIPEMLYEGFITQIYIEQDNGDLIYECDAQLVRMALKWRDRFPFSIKQRKEISVVKECWVVNVVSSSPFENGTELTRWVMRRDYSNKPKRERDEQYK